MAASRAPARRRIHTTVWRRFAARLLTGPLGFFVAGVIDWLELLAQYLGARARGRRPDW
jgi:hypothetical protein